MATLQVVLRPGEDGWLVAECPTLPGCVSQGRTREEALANIREAIELERGLRLLASLPEDEAERLHETTDEDGDALIRELS